MEKQTTKDNETSTVCFEQLEDWARERIAGWLQELMEEEVTEFLGRSKSQRRGAQGEGVRVGYRNGYGKPRKLSTSMGTLRVKRPRVRDTQKRFESRVLPLFAKRTRQVGGMLPTLYLHGLAQGDFELALRGLLGEGAPLSASSMGRLKAQFALDYEQWNTRDLSELQVVYAWADGLYVKAGLEKDKAALLVIIGALEDGSKVLLCCESGQRESKEAWKRILRDLKARGLRLPALHVADGHLGIWAALGELHPSGDEQRCWNHRIVNVLDRLPTREQPRAAQLLRQMMYATSQADCEKKRNLFVARYEAQHPKAAHTLLRDWERMVTFFRYPKAHWVHLRTTNPVESPFAAVRLRTDAAKRFKRIDSAAALIWKLLQVAEQKSWRKLNAPDVLPAVFAGQRCVDGVFENNPTHKEIVAIAA